MKREQWNSKLGFLLAAIGSAVGLGNIWRFPYTAATNGGGAFLLPYFFAIITAGIPILILEFTIGHRYRAGAPVALGKMNKKWEVLGWFQVMVVFSISVYYAAIVGWTLSYIGFSFTQAWGSDTAGFFLTKYLGTTESPLSLGGIRMNLVIPFLISWGLTFAILWKGVSKGIEKVTKIMIPALLVMMVIIVIRGVTLPGATDGLNYLFTPDWKSLLNPSIWVAAYGQVFFSLSVGFAIMISYSSYLPKKTDIVNSAFITGFSNHGFELLAAIGIFSVVGYMAGVQNVSVAEVSKGGIGLAFIAIPAIIDALPGFNTAFGVLFFGALFTAGITSLISINQAVITSVSDKFALSRQRAVVVVIVPAFVCSALFITGAGLMILDIVDQFINSFGVVLGGLVEVFLVGWFFNLKDLRKKANEFSNFHIGKWWLYMIKLVTVVVLGIMLILKLIERIRIPYEGYDTPSLMVYGWGAVGICVIGALVLKSLKGKKGYLEHTTHKEEE